MRKGKKNKSKKPSEVSQAVRSDAPTAQQDELDRTERSASASDRLSADAPEWHPPSFLLETVAAAGPVIAQEPVAEDSGVIREPPADHEGGSEGALPSENWAKASSSNDVSDTNMGSTNVDGQNADAPACVSPNTVTTIGSTDSAATCQLLGGHSAGESGGAGPRDYIGDADEGDPEAAPDAPDDGQKLVHETSSITDVPEAGRSHDCAQTVDGAGEATPRTLDEEYSSLERAPVTSSASVSSQETLEARTATERSPAGDNLDNILSSDDANADDEPGAAAGDAELTGTGPAQQEVRAALAKTRDEEKGSIDTPGDVAPREVMFKNSEDCESSLKAASAAACSEQSSSAADVAADAAAAASMSEAMGQSFRSDVEAAGAVDVDAEADHVEAKATPALAPAPDQECVSGAARDASETGEDGETDKTMLEGERGEDGARGEESTDDATDDTEDGGSEPDVSSSSKILSVWGGDRITASPSLHLRVAVATATVGLLLAGLARRRRVG